MSKEPMVKQDFKKNLKHLYKPSAKEVSVVDVPPMIFLMLDGIGDPNTAQAYNDAVEALYSVAYTIKFLLKKEAAFDYAVMPLEGLWWAEEGRNANREDWHWTMMIVQPDIVTDEWFGKGMEQAQQKKHLAALEKIRLESLHEGTTVQMMHIGPFATEEQTLEKMERFLTEQHYIFHGKHHEIYLSDPRKTAPEKLRTVLRHPVRGS